MKQFLILFSLLFVCITYNKSYKSQKSISKEGYVVTKSKTSCICTIQKFTSFPYLGEKHLGPFDTRTEAENAICKDIDPEFSDQRKCWLANPKIACE